MTVIYNMSIDRADKPWIGDRRFTETTTTAVVVERDFIYPRDQWVKTDISATIWSAGSGSRSRFKLIRMSRVGLQG